MHGDFRVGDWLVQPALGRISTDQQSVRVRAKVMDLLVYLAARPGEVISKEALLDGVWSTEAITESALTRTVTELRQALGDEVEHPRMLETIPKRGYRLIAPVTRVSDVATTDESGSIPLQSRKGFTVEEALARLRDVAAALLSVRWASTWMLLFVVLALVTGLVIGALVWHVLPAAPSVIRGTFLEVSPAEEVGTGSTLDVLPGGSRRALAWSPDGKTLAFIGLAAGVRRIYLRDLDNEVARPLDGTDNARNLTFSPDGQWIAFWAGPQTVLGTVGAIWKVRTAGGPPARICDAEPVRGMVWGASRIVYTGRRQLRAVAADGGEPLTLLQSDLYVSSAILLPGETALMYTEYGKLWTSGDERVVVLPAGATAAKVLLLGAADAQYLPTGHLAFLRQGTLYVAPFDAKSLEVHGGGVPVLNGVTQSFASWGSFDHTLAGQFAISPQGTLAYVPGSPSLPTSEPVAVNRRGEITSLGARAAIYRSRVEPSPDGVTFAMDIQTPVSVRLHLYDRIRGTLMPPLPEASDQETFSPVWSSDGRIALSVQQSGRIHLAIYRPGSPAPPQQVSGSAGFVASSWSHDGERLVGTKDNDLWLYSPKGQDSKWTQLTASPKVVEQHPAWSPDGRWLAYTSDTSGGNDVYVRPFPGLGPVIQISTNRGVAPAWNPNGKELFYIEERPLPDDPLLMMSVDMSSPDRPGRPVPLFPFSPKSLLFVPCSPTSCYSVAPDGQTFYTLRMLPRQPARVTQIKVIFNWLEDVKRLLKAQ